MLAKTEKLLRSMNTFEFGQLQAMTKKKKGTVVHIENA